MRTQITAICQRSGFHAARDACAPAATEADRRAPDAQQRPLRRLCSPQLRSTPRFTRFSTFAKLSLFDVFCNIRWWGLTCQEKACSNDAGFPREPLGTRNEFSPSDDVVTAPNVQGGSGDTCVMKCLRQIQKNVRHSDEHWPFAPGSPSQHSPDDVTARSLRKLTSSTSKRHHESAPTCNTTKPIHTLKNETEQNSKTCHFLLTKITLTKIKIQNTRNMISCDLSKHGEHDET